MGSSACTDNVCRRYFLLAADVLLYFVLALFDVLAHVVVDNSFVTFKAFDITTGMSF